jgi:ribosomal-protein-alanine N-acetyltransferase
MHCLVLNINLGQCICLFQAQFNETSMNINLESSQLIIRNFTQSDAADYSDFKKSNNVGGSYHCCDNLLEKHQQLIDDLLPIAAYKKHYRLAIKDRLSGVFIGACFLQINGVQAAIHFDISTNSINLREKTAEALSELVNYTFNHLGLRCIYSTVIEGHQLAEQLCIKLGMSLNLKIIENIYFKHKWCNTLIYQQYKMTV